MNINADMSVVRLFWKRFIIRFAIVILATMIGVFVFEPYFVNLAETNVQMQTTKTAIVLSELASFDIEDDRFREIATVSMGDIKETIETQHKFIKNASMSLYDLTNKKLVANSIKTAAIDSDAVIDWWKTISGVDFGLPTIHLDEQLHSFYNKNKEYSIILREMCAGNGVLYPKTIQAINQSGALEDELTLEVPSAYAVYTCDTNEIVNLRLVGNNVTDVVYDKMTKFDAQGEESVVEIESTDLIDSEANIIEGAVEFEFEEKDKPTKIVYDNVQITYGEIDQNSKIQVTSCNFSANGVEYQLDCGYYYDYWTEISGFVLIFGIISIVLCVLFAYICAIEEKNTLKCVS